MNARESLNDFTFEGGFDSSLQPLDPRTVGKLCDGSFNIINIDNGRNVPFGGLTSKGANTGSRILTTLGNTWGGIKDITVAAKTFTVISVANQIPITAHGFLTGIAVVFTTSGTLPTGLALATTYYVISIDVNTISVATTYANSLLGTAVSITVATGSGTHTATPSALTITATGSLFQDIGASIWGIGSGQPHKEGTNFTKLQLSSLLKVLLSVNGSYSDAASGSFVAGLSQPSSPGVAVIDAPGTGFTGLIDGAVSFKIARIRLSTGARSIASNTSVVVVPAKKTVRVTFPLASTGQTYWHLFATQQGFGGVGIHYQLAYNGSVDISETIVAAGTAGGAYASGVLTFVTNPLNTETIAVNGVTFTFVTGASTATNVHIGATKNDTAVNFAAVLNGSVNVAITPATYTPQTATVAIVFDVLGATGNTFTLANSSGTVAVTRSAATLTGGEVGVVRSLEIDYRDGDLLPIEAYIDDYPPPAGTQAARVESSMVVFGCYSDSVDSPSGSSPGTTAAVSLPNYPESYKPRHILFFPEPVVTVLSRLIDSYCYVLCRNSIHAVQFVGWRDDLPSCTVTTVSPEVGVVFPQNVTQAYGRLFLWTESAGMVAMNPDGSLDFEFGAAIRKYTKNWDNTTAVGFDPLTRSVTCSNGSVMFLFCMQSGNWSSPVYVSDIAAGTIEASVTTRGEAVTSINNAGSHTAYSVNQGGSSLPVFYASNFAECSTKKGKNVYEMLISGEFTVPGTLYMGLHSNFRPRMFRDATTTSGSGAIGSATATFTLADTNNEVFLFGTGIGNKTFTADAATDLLTFSSTASMLTGQAITVSNSGGALPAGLAAATTYYIIVISTTTIKLATSYNNSLLGTAINITTNGTGTQTAVINFLMGKIASPTTASFTITNLDGTALTASATLTGVTIIIANQVFTTTVSGIGNQDTISVYPELIEARQLSVSTYISTDSQLGQVFSALVMGDVSQSSEINI